MAPVPPPPPRRKSTRSGIRDIESGQRGGSGLETMEDAPDKTLMEMLQTYLKKQDLYTRIVLVVVLLVLAGGALGAYAVMLFFAIEKKDTKYIIVCTVFTMVLGWVLWKVSTATIDSIEIFSLSCL